jgi:hypothetical protein
MSLRSLIKEKFWPIVITSLLTFFISTFVWQSVHTTDQVNILRSKHPITKLEMKIVSDTLIYVTILNSEQLESINCAFQAAQEKDISKSKVADIWADINVYKEGNKINLFIRQDSYNGWMIEVGNATLTNDYLFSLVKRYAKKD